MRLSTIAYQIIDLEPEIGEEKTQTAIESRPACCTGDQENCILADACLSPIKGGAPASLSCPCMA